MISVYILSVLASDVSASCYFMTRYFKFNLISNPFIHSCVQEVYKGMKLSFVVTAYI